MGVHGRRQLRAALSILLRPFLLALALTIFVRLFLSPSSSSSSSKRQPPPPPLTKALVIASTSDQPRSETSWIDEEVPEDWQVYNYVTDRPASPGLAVPANKGNEAMAYLTYIVDHYDALPDVVFFHHAHRRGWHQELDSPDEVRRLRAGYVARAGFASARCLPGCENVIPLAGYSVDPAALPQHGRNVQLATLLDEFLDAAAGERVPRRLAAPCCAQFAASRAAIRRRGVEWWARLRRWLAETPLDSMTSGRLMEHTWHVWLGQEAQ
ncbi:uncharacterized protein E0L32_005102 [Thyridium curvatum]|uniref:Uncharacterized protein n=1 Tax=Thyridium curvatum TaxID=1093900 RepID=A0A507B4N7_9PEZI|nr:uncharacterized protein E0L32_005102 [Thyridium curvatum]TPX14707.1 hypothetical protein E0L32_005102 [Thyridium curvatum]